MLVFVNTMKTCNVIINDNFFRRLVISCNACVPGADGRYVWYADHEVGRHGIGPAAAVCLMSGMNGWSTSGGGGGDREMTSGTPCHLPNDTPKPTIICRVSVLTLHSACSS